MPIAAFETAATRFKALPRNQQLAILFGVPVIIAGTAAWFTWKVMAELGADPSIPQLLRREGMGKWEEISGVETQIAGKQLIINRKDDIIQRIQGLQDEIADAEERLPREAEKAQMRETIERLAREIRPEMGKVIVKSVRILEDSAPTGGSAKRAGLRTVVYQTEVTGDLNGLIAYIDAIEKNTRFMSVAQIAWRGGEVAVDKDNKGKLSFLPHSVKMDLVTYVYSSAPAKGRAQ